MPTLTAQLERAVGELRQQVADWPRSPGRAAAHDIGRVENVGDGVATLTGLADVRLDEVVVFAGGARGLVVALAADRVDVVLLDPGDSIAAGSVVERTGTIARVPVGDGLLGRILDPLGRPRDGAPPPPSTRRDPIERPAPGILDRDLVAEPLRTGVLAVDALIPIGRGQRELIIGDRSTGKTAIALDAMLNQHKDDVVCIYAAVGQKLSSIDRVVATMREHGAADRTIFVVAPADAPPGLQWIAPFAACTMAEHFRDSGRHALLVIDDLTKHAIIHRQLALLLRKPPGREAYPGDIFHLHARLLERAAKLSPARGGGSLTALPIAETQAGNLAAYIPTNLVSITDGQILLDARRFHAGQRPAVDVGRSVSRVGGKAQNPSVKALSETLKLDYAQFLELEAFTRFGQTLEPGVQATIDHGRRIGAVLTQPAAQPWSQLGEMALLLALRARLLDALPLDRVGAFKSRLDLAVCAAFPALSAALAAGGGLGDADRERLSDWLATRTEALAHG